MPDGKDGENNHPFASISGLLKKQWANNPGMFNIEMKPVMPDIVASDFLHSPEYQTHPAVEQSRADGGVTLGVGLYSDGVQVGEISQPETLYVVFLTFPHLGAEECAKPHNKHIYTVYRKSSVNKHTLDDIWDVLLWELQALAQGKEQTAS